MMENFLKTQVRKIFYTNVLANKIYGLFRSKPVSRSYNLNHLALFDENLIRGTMQRDEAIFLFSIIKMTRPKTLIEFGFLRGHSSLNFLRALDKDSRLYSFDISDTAREIASSLYKNRKNFQFVYKSQLDFEPEDVNNRKIDMVFYDAVWDADLNIRTFEKIKPSLSDDAIIILHDTDTWKKKFMNETHFKYEKTKSKEDWLNEEEFQQQRGQREFYNEFLKKYPEYSAVNFHCSTTNRNGMTLIQKKKFLQTAKLKA